MNARTNHGLTSLIFACQNGHKDVVKLVLDNSNNNIDMNTINNDGMTVFSTEHWIECNNLSWIDSIDGYLPKWKQRWCPNTSRQSEQNHWFEYKKWSWNDCISVSSFIKTKRSCQIWICHENVAKTDRF